MDDGKESHQVSMMQLQSELDQTKAELQQVQKELKDMEKIKIQVEIYNKKLRLEVEKVNCLLRLCQATNSSYSNTEDIGTQVDEKMIAMDIDYQSYACTNPVRGGQSAEDAIDLEAGDTHAEDKPLAPWATADKQDNEEEEDGEVKEEPVSIADSLKEAAESAMQQSGYVYDDTSGLYYDHKSGFYYDHSNQLYYEPQSGTYYYCDTETGAYTFHSQVSLSGYPETQPDSEPLPDNVQESRIKSHPNMHHSGEPPGSIPYHTNRPDFPEYHRDDMPIRNIQNDQPVFGDREGRMHPDRPPSSRNHRPGGRDREDVRGFDDDPREQRSNKRCVIDLTDGPHGKPEDTMKKKKIDDKDQKSKGRKKRKSKSDKKKEVANNTISSKPTIYMATAAKIAKFDLNSRKVIFEKTQEETEDSLSKFGSSYVCNIQDKYTASGAKIILVDVIDTANRVTRPNASNRPLTGKSLELFMQFAQRAKVKTEYCGKSVRTESDKNRENLVEVKITKEAERYIRSITAESLKSEQPVQNLNVNETTSSDLDKPLIGPSLDLFIQFAQNKQVKQDISQDSINMENEECTSEALIKSEQTQTFMASVQESKHSTETSNVDDKTTQPILTYNTNEHVNTEQAQTSIAGVTSEVQESKHSIENSNVDENITETIFTYKKDEKLVKQETKELMDISACEFDQDSEKQEIGGQSSESEAGSAALEGEEFLTELEELIQETFLGKSGEGNAIDHDIKGIESTKKSSGSEVENHISPVVVADSVRDSEEGDGDGHYTSETVDQSQQGVAMDSVIGNSSATDPSVETSDEHGCKDRSNVICAITAIEKQGDLLPRTTCGELTGGSGDTQRDSAEEAGISSSEYESGDRHLNTDNLVDNLGSLGSQEASEEVEDGEICEMDEEKQEKDQTDDGQIDEDQNSDHQLDEDQTDYDEYQLDGVEMDEDQQDEASEKAGSQYWPPCIRVMVTESDTLKVGDLYIITCTGVTIGSDPNKNHGVLIQDHRVSKTHCSIFYYEEERSYIVQDAGSLKGTFLNGKRLSQPREQSEWFRVHHLDLLAVGGTAVCLHIHSGTTTCAGCEPGLVQADTGKGTENTTAHLVQTKADREKLRRKELKQIKKKFGLENAAYVNDQLTSGQYKDKAAERRQTVGSDHPYQKDDPSASVHVAISTQNKGHKLLSKMGWKEGEGLGKSTEGITQPIQVGLRTSQTAGLGSQGDTSHSLDNVQTVRHSAKWLKTRQRYDEIQKSQPKDTQPPKEASTKDRKGSRSKRK